MSVEDKQAQRTLSRELFRRQSLDLADVIVSVMRGVGYISGVIRPQSGVYLNMKEEMQILKDMAKKVPGVRDIVIDAKIEQTSKR